MSKITGIGANVYDTLYTVNHYPDEDTKLSAEAAVCSGGGPVATGLVAASKLGADTSYIGVLTDDAGGVFLKEDMERYNVSTAFTDIVKGCSSFSSCIWLSGDKKTRTCVFYKGNIPPLKLSEKQKKEIADADILMIDGNEMQAAIEGARVAKENGTKVLYDAGGLYKGVENLIGFSDILIPSEEYALGFTKASSAFDAAKILYDKYRPEAVVITQGKKGGIMYDGNSLRTYPATPAEVIDSNGAGDVFHGAFAFAYSKGLGLYECCLFSSAVSAIKCTRLGARKGAPGCEEVVNYLKEQGYDEFKKALEK